MGICLEVFLRCIFVGVIMMHYELLGKNTFQVGDILLKVRFFDQLIANTYLKFNKRVI